MRGFLTLPVIVVLVVAVTVQVELGSAEVVEEETGGGWLVKQLSKIHHASLLGPSNIPLKKAANSLGVSIYSLSPLIRHYPFIWKECNAQISSQLEEDIGFVFAAASKRENP